MPASDRGPATPTTPELVLAQRMHALGFLADGVAHDLANPLGAILGLASLIAADERVPDDLRTDARLLREEADRTYRLVSTLLDVTRTRPPVLRPTAVAPTVTSLLELATHPLAGVTVEVAIASDLPEVEVDPSAFRYAIAGLVVDALERLGAPSASGRLRIEAAATGEGPRATVRLSLIDDGRPVEPGATTVTGIGALLDRLGVPVIQDTIDAAGHPRNRTLLDLRVPIQGEAWPAAGVGTTPGSPDAGDPRRPLVLVCDDEASVRALLVRVLERAGCEAIEAGSGEEALLALDQAAVDAIVSDHHLPAMTGIDLYERLAATRPDLRQRFVLLSGDPDSPEIVAFIARSGVPIVAKPFDLAGIEATIRAVVLPVTGG
ncbi:MAG TPA: response regulator [Candidatus Limnocylindrales bacterium]